MTEVERERRDANVIGAWALAVADAIRASAEQAAGTAGGGPAALVAVVADPGMSIGELSQVLGLTHPGTVRLVSRLAERGWMVREAGPGRCVRLVPTPAGRDAERRLVAARQAAVSAAHAALGADRLRELAAIVEPLLAGAAGSVTDLRRLCRLCDRGSCDRCPVAESLEQAGRPAAAHRPAGEALRAPAPSIGGAS